MRFVTILGVVFLCSCANPSNKGALFKDVSSQTGITFNNELTPTKRINPYTYRNFYNGAGVAIGDINNDGLPDIYFAGNQVDNKLYLNLGNFKFKDITESAGVACHNVWCTGVTFADINGDGLLDIYVCKSGDPEAPHRYNELFINNGDLTFTERSKEYGLDVTGLSVQASFFDYDKDGDLDCYLLTNSIKSVGHYDLVKGQREIPDSTGAGNRFLLNENGKFVDYSEQAGIYRSNIGFGLGITLGDFNDDGWTDVFISNDFFERDYLYINNQHGGFKESLTDYFQSISMGSMGADFADLNDDGDPELFVTEMLPDSLNRKKTKTVYENWDKYQMDVKNGYYHQFPRNVLSTRIGRTDYAEVGRLAGVSASEWSWGALIFDMNNDGLKDIFIANGIYKDLLDRDYLTFTGSPENVRQLIKGGDDAVLKLINEMPSSPVPNCAFENEGNFAFKNMSDQWGMGKPTFSSGSAYGDLDGDGDLDLVVSNLNAPATIYQNQTDTAKYRSVSLSFTSKTKNRFVVGASVTAYCQGKKFSADNFVTRGFQSSVEPGICLGVGENIKTIDSVVIKWPDQGCTVLKNVPTNKALRITQEDCKVEPYLPGTNLPSSFALAPVADSVFRHRASGLIDFNRDRLLPMMYSNETPFLTKGDIDGDGQDEIYIGGGKDQPGEFIKYKAGKFVKAEVPAMAPYQLSEETHSTLFDADGDGDLDLYMACGGRFFPTSSSAMQDRLFLNNGKGTFTESKNPLPFQGNVSTSVVVPFDFDGDGDLDLFVGVRFNPFEYGIGGRAFLLENDGKGIFQDVTKEVAPELLNIGMVTDAKCFDDQKDLVVVGDWMPITILLNVNGRYKVDTTMTCLRNTEGWWHDVEVKDLNKDGAPDFVVANHGDNTFFKPGDRMYVNDFDGNGSLEQIFCTKVNGKYYPIVDRDELLSQLPSLKKEILYYKEYAKMTIDDLFPPEIESRSKVFQVNVLSSVMVLSGPDGYKRVDLPLQAQFSTLYSLLVDDFDGDGVDDLIAGGNQFEVKPQFGRFDASEGWFFKGHLDHGKFYFSPGVDLDVKGQIRDIVELAAAGKKYIMFAKYDDALEIYKSPH